MQRYWPLLALVATVTLASDADAQLSTLLDDVKQWRELHPARFDPPDAFGTNASTTTAALATPNGWTLTTVLGAILSGLLTGFASRLFLRMARWCIGRALYLWKTGLLSID
ncbi:hypothetical protein SDRG_13960 [Saprolegnia diclina VS20]|uniref:Uncharacterized protein n=1 Tax=Saprolegnia diclina (strain VS20) TaxID=1156394 RepID=T0PS02_SAPDV|nr:hypothetical protein SDRG_13960 [Saprolegnia diclina VS20]EQC28279.1 hypothetical protein SDRG_13960 [Saprolegnia diclina VS20]|eukprot:XP_008618283.1 hypothetical protein SDRG_13960 [Saprolegnia diclina VS20]